MITASELLGEVRAPQLRGTPRTVRKLAVQQANAANLHAQLRARRESQAPAREARKARIAEVGAFIKSRRIALDLSQHDVAMLTGYPTRAQVGAFELGREALPAKRVASMAAALQCDPERLRVPPLREYLAGGGLE